ncbi:hypothetical protein BCR44DRAFT_30535 [Catenaria anguillulae PL171]|uniref:Uncharacterized protein n=1 Tax=Catenaria anguillulae PL171 TaxID=765915 RepID=A0A1Y2HNM0_9FUNG|nr:hypothetical protein BCR44DRAFT_30535 [Catenaria anguillulae PL171]
MCDFHAKRNEFMTGCDQCTVPSTGIPDWTKNDFNLLNKTCNSFVLHGEMCSSMPGMGGCSNWRQMCSTLPNASELLPKWCWADAMAARNITYNATLANQFILDKAPVAAEGKGNGAVARTSGLAVGGGLAAFVLAAVMVL